MRPTNRFLNRALILSLALLPLAVGCTNKQGETEAPVTVTVDIVHWPLFVNINSGVAVQFSQIDLASHLKNPSQTDPRGFSNVELTSYTVTYSRVDGGTKVPPPETFAGTGLLPSGGSVTLNNYPTMYAYALTQSPLDQLLPFNGGIDQETGRSEIDMAFTIQFFGETASGQRVASEKATASIIFQAQ